VAFFKGATIQINSLRAQLSNSGELRRIRPVRLSALLADARELATNGATEAGMPETPLAKTQNRASVRDAATAPNINEANPPANHRPKR
jgi:hypothetical protein